MLELRTTDFGCSQRIQEVCSPVQPWHCCKLLFCRCPEHCLDLHQLASSCTPGVSLTLCYIMQSGKLNKRTGTPLYMAPELFMRYYGVESDQVITAVFCKGLLCKVRCALITAIISTWQYSNTLNR